MRRWRSPSEAYHQQSQHSRVSTPNGGDLAGADARGHASRSVPSKQRSVDHRAWTAARLRDWPSTRHSLPIELALILGVYAVYEGTRGLVAGDQRVALHHAQDVISLERSLHLFVEGPVQHAALAIPGLIGTLDFAYLTLHLW